MLLLRNKFDGNPTKFLAFIPLPTPNLVYPYAIELKFDRQVEIDIGRQTIIERQMDGQFDKEKLKR